MFHLILCQWNLEEKGTDAIYFPFGGDRDEDLEGMMGEPYTVVGEAGQIEV